jgi:polyisoprenoid-binding protein YceI
MNALRSFTPAFRRTVCVATAAAALLAACRTPPPSSPTAGATVAPAAVSASTSNDSVFYSIDESASQLLVFAYREGAMSALGHNHVFRIRGLAGSVQLATELTRSRFELHFPVAEISIDEPALRAEAGEDFASVVSDSARTGTRNNMLGDKLLQAMQFPTISLTSERVESQSEGAFTVLTRINVRGVDYSVPVPLRLLRSQDELTVTGEFALQQSQLGLTPFSVLLGALRVSDEMRLRFKLVARRVKL